MDCRKWDQWKTCLECAGKSESQNCQPLEILRCKKQRGLLLEKVAFILIAICPFYLANIFSVNNTLKRNLVRFWAQCTITMIGENRAADAVNNLLWVSFQGASDNAAFSETQKMHRCNLKEHISLFTGLNTLMRKTRQRIFWIFLLEVCSQHLPMPVLNDCMQCLGPALRL